MLVFALLLIGVNYGSALGHVDEDITYEELALMNRELVKMNGELMQTIKAADQRMLMVEGKIKQLEKEVLILNHRLEGAELSGHDAIPKVSTHTHVSRFVVDSNDKVAFLARLIDLDSSFRLGPSTVKFDKVYTNSGRQYNATSGIFIAPSQGLYLISATLLSPVDAEVRATIYVNNDRAIVSIFGHGSGGERDAESQVALLDLNKGDTVAVFNETAIENPPWNNLPFNSFTGALLFAY